jgi:hypothetical protein
MVVETLGDAFAAGWRITARCAWGKREGMKTRRECTYTRELDLETLAWTRGPNFRTQSELEIGAHRKPPKLAS